MENQNSQNSELWSWSTVPIDKPLKQTHKPSRLHKPSLKISKSILCPPASGDTAKNSNGPQLKKPTRGKMTYKQPAPLPTSGPFPEDPTSLVIKVVALELGHVALEGGDVLAEDAPLGPDLQNVTCARGRGFQVVTGTPTGIIHTCSFPDPSHPYPSPSTALVTLTGQNELLFGQFAPCGWQEIEFQQNQLKGGTGMRLQIRVTSVLCT